MPLDPLAKGTFGTYDVSSTQKQYVSENFIPI